jgi:predicted amidophosphoribosyltransferase
MCCSRCGLALSQRQTICPQRGWPIAVHRVFLCPPVSRYDGSVRDGVKLADWV